MTEPAFLEYAGKKISDIPAESIIRQEGSPLVYIEEKPFHECRGYLVPCLTPELYAAEYSANGNSLSPQGETSQRETLTKSLTQRYFNFVERGSRIPATYEQLQSLKQKYEQAEGAEKTHWGALLVGTMVYRIRQLSEALLKASQEPNDRKSLEPGVFDETAGQDVQKELPSLEPGAPDLATEIKEHYISLMTDEELKHSPRLDGNKQDLDNIIGELISELAKPASRRNGRTTASLQDINKLRVDNIANAMDKIDQTHRSLVELMEPPSPLFPSHSPAQNENDTEFRQLKTDLLHYVNAARVRVAIPKTDFANYPQAEVSYRTARDKVDAELERLRRTHPAEKNLEALQSALESNNVSDAKEAMESYSQRRDFLSQVQSVQEGRRLIDDMCYYRDPMPKTLDAYRQKNGLPPFEEPKSQVTGGGHVAKGVVGEGKSR